MRYAGADLMMARAASTFAAMADEPWRYDYFHALRLVDAQHPGKPRLGTARRPVDEPIRLGQVPDLSFAPSAIGQVDLAGPGPARMRVRFFGLFGPNGPLPLGMTEYARERELHHDDRTLGRFADLFHHRLLLLFYRAWAQAQPTVSLDRPAEDRFASYVGSLVGIGTPATRDRSAAPDHAQLYFAGLLARQVRNADGLASLLTGWLRRPVRVEPYAGQWLELPPEDRTRIGRAPGARPQASARLGGGAVLGRMAWDRQHNVRIHVGPLDLDAYESLLPGSPALSALSALVEQYLGQEFGWSLCLTLRPGQAGPARPGRHGRLGWTSWACGPGPGRTPELHLDPAAALRTLRRRPTPSVRTAPPAAPALVP